MKRNIILSVIALFFCGTFASAQTEEDKYAKHVLLEEFTTEMCPNCPPATSMLKEFFNTFEEADKVVTVAHHAGYYEDWLTNESDKCMMWFFNSQYTYAPAMMFDRYPNFRDEYSHEETPVGFIRDGYELQKYIKRRLNKKAHVSIDITAEYDGDKTLTVYVKGDRTKVFSDTDPRIFVYVTENEVSPKNQAGAGAGYKHLHVSRAYNAEWGDALTWNGDAYDYKCTITIDPSWNKDNMEIVAAISAFDPQDPSLCVVDNSRAVPFSVTNGIDDAQVESNLVSTEYYTLDGVKVSEVTRGMYIEKKTYSDGRVETKKINR